LKKKPRSSQEPVIAHLVLYLSSKYIENGGVIHNFESGLTKVHFSSSNQQKILMCFLSLIICP